MPIDYPLEGFSYPTFTLLMDSYNLYYTVHSTKHNTALHINSTICNNGIQCTFCCKVRSGPHCVDYKCSYAGVMPEQGVSCKFCRYCSLLENQDDLKLDFKVICFFILVVQALHLMNPSDATLASLSVLKY